MSMKAEVWPALDALDSDTRYSVRRLWARPGYTLLAILTLALGVGGTASVYGVARGVLFDPLPYAHAREVGVFWKKTDWIHEEFLHIRGHVPGFRDVALYRQRDVIVRDGDAPARLLPAVSASAELFAVLGGLALGANRQRLTQQLVVEVLLLATAAGALGAAFAWSTFAIVTRALPLGAWAESATPDWRVFAMAMGIAIASALLVILVPALSLYRGDLWGVLSRARTAGIGGRGGRLENGLVIAQVALAVMIAAGAALLGRSVAKLYAVEPGVRTEGVAVVDVMLGSGLNHARRVQTLDELATALRELPGARSAGSVQNLPLRGGGYNLPIRVDEPPAVEGLSTEYRIVTPDYLESVGMSLRAGRTISASDRRDAERVVVINEALAQKYFSGVDPIGKLVGGDIGPKAARVIGVVANAVERHLTGPAVPVRYVPVAQTWVDDPQSLVVLAAPGVDETTLLEPARRTIERVAPAVVVQQTTTMRRVLDTAIGPARQVVLLLSLLTALALTLGAVGVYGVIAHFAARRRRDWAIRIALGLPGSQVIAQVVRHGALLLVAGIGAGVLGAALLTRFLSALLYGVSAIDATSFAAAGAALLVVGLAAALVPAWRAGMTDPVNALREQ